MRLVVTGGGTGGHINPAIAISNEVKQRYKDSEILFIGTKRGMESRLVPEAGYDIKYINVEGFTKKSKIHNASVLLKFSVGVLKCIGILGKFKPDAVVGTGGYVSASAALAAHIMKIPVLIHEQNAVAGKTSKMLSKYADKICVSFDDVNVLKCPEKTVITGNPVRAAFKTVIPREARGELGFSSDIPLVVCVSGSLGALKINEYMTEFIKKHHKDDIQMVLVTGDQYFENAKNTLKEANINIESDRVKVLPYSNDMEKYLAAADLVISRSGATFMSEIAYLGKPSILIPSPNVAENHQEINADSFVKNKAALKLLEENLTYEKFEKEILKLVNDKYELQVMSFNAGKSGVKNSAELIVNEIEKIIKK